MVQRYEAGSLAPATVYQTWAWKGGKLPRATDVSSTRVQPAGPLTVTGSSPAYTYASSRSPLTTPLGRLTVWLTALATERKVGCVEAAGSATRDVWELGMDAPAAVPSST
ncbi:MAG TPA: hypothetical protein VI056_12295 [Candidatus Limnocylindria bacterium]